VIIDTPAALAVSDSVPLMQNVSGVVLVARMNKSKRDTLRRLRKIIDSAHGRLLGTVATGVTSGPGYEKYSQAYYAPIDHNSKRGRKLRKRGRVEPSTPAPTANGNGVADEAPTVRD
jgi:Mrp family chromosome partitioning ATPase